MKIIISILLSFFFLTSSNGQSKFQKDFVFYWQTVKENFAYFDRQHTNWDKVKAIYQPYADTIKNKVGLVHLLEKMNNELYNGHVFLNTNTPASNRSIPTGADIKLSYAGNKFIVSEIRPGFNAGLCGIKPGMIITKFNDQPITEAVINISSHLLIIYLQPFSCKYKSNQLVSQIFFHYFFWGSVFLNDRNKGRISVAGEN